MARRHGTGRHAARVQAVVADARNVEEDIALHLVQLPAAPPRQTLSRLGSLLRVQRRAAQVVVPVGARLDLHRFARDQGDGPGGGLVVARGGALNRSS